MSEPTHAISIHNLYKAYSKVWAIGGMNLELDAGRVVGLMGENGCGKTTLLKICAGVVQDYTGDVAILGRTPGVETKAHVSFLPDKPYFSDTLTVGGAIEIFEDFYDDFDAPKIRELLTFLNLQHDMKIGTMSKGMVEKLQVALVMSRAAKVYLLDEPLSGVDPAARSVILESIVKNFSDDALMVMSTHLIHDVESIIDETVFMREGRVIFQASADQIREVDGKSVEEKFREVYACSPMLSNTK